MTADEITHQHRHQGNREHGGTGHGEGLGKGQRCEQAAFLCLQGKHRQKAQGDDQQREEQRRANLHRGLANDLPAVVIGDLGFFHVFVHVFDHDNGSIHHGADGDGDAAQ